MSASLRCIAFGGETDYRWNQLEIDCRAVSVVGRRDVRLFYSGSAVLRGVRRGVRWTMQHRDVLLNSTQLDMNNGYGRTVISR